MTILILDKVGFRENTANNIESLRNDKGINPSRKHTLPNT